MDEKKMPEMEKVYNPQAIETELYQVPADTAGCMGCGYCEKNGSCVCKDQVCEIAARLDESENIVYKEQNVAV